MVDLSNQMARIRSVLTAPEMDRFQELGQKCAAGMHHAIQAVKPGMTEMEIASVLGAEVQKVAAQPIVNLIATDERIFRFRHPLPTEKRLERYALLVLCGRWKGLVCSISRLVYFGALPAELKRKMLANAYVNAVFHNATRPGVPISQVFQSAVQAYNETGYSSEWTLHHQGGPAGYESREFLGRPDSTDSVYQNQAYAWNPSISGCKYEDTILVGAETNQEITEIAGWPTIEVNLNGQSILCPAILEIQ
jgi:antitoxin VapB